ncbi:MAG: hypothetical protein DRQ78_07990, partial [Epsilonproteobacteria bacterium]
SIAVVLVGLLSLLIIILIVQYNMIDDENYIEEIAQATPSKKISTKEKAKSYLKGLEGYEDVDVKVDATKEDNANRVMVKSEVSDNRMDAAVEDKAKTSYMENLANYTEKVKNEKPSDTVNIKPANDKSGDPEKLEYDEVEDEIGMAIEAALEDL